jgi:hypothetical protein
MVPETYLRPCSCWLQTLFLCSAALLLATSEKFVDFKGFGKNIGMSRGCSLEEAGKIQEPFIFS